MTHLKAATFGSAMVDIIAVLASDSIEQISFSNALQQYLMVEPGRKVEAEEITTHIGGGGLNTAVSLQRLGCEVLPIVKTGTGANRDHVLEHCDKHGLSREAVLITEEATTGSAIMIASHENNAAIFTKRGANTLLVKEDVNAIALDGYDIVHAAPLSGNSAQLLPLIAANAKKAGAFFSANPGIRQITTRANTILKAASDMSLISINEVEAAALAPCLSAIDENLSWRQVETGEPVLELQGGTISMKNFCEVLHQHGPQYVLITAGGDGAYLYDGETLHNQPIVQAQVAGTAGAGDSFVSTLAWGLKSGYDAQKALLLAAHNASSVVSHVNTIDGLLSRDELLAKL